MSAIRPKIALVTGASTGLGKAYVTSLCQLYPQLDEIWLLARRGELLREQAQSYPLRTRIIALDLEQTETACWQIQALLEELKPEVLVLINNAGCGYNGEFAHMKQGQITSVLSLNVLALTRLSSLIKPYLPHGAIVLQVASVAAFLPQAGAACYAASKAYVLHFARALRLEWSSQGINVCAVCPNPLATDFHLRAGGGDAPQGYKRKFCEDVAAVATASLKAAARGKAMYLHSIPAKIVFWASRCLPQTVLLRLSTYLFYKGGRHEQ